mmetsp:Transcript_18056/g.33896  ORF Transcript_18056/g.33896 Transcript_18056/m.33896 type:complete len:541 (+) Transcript_18056:78-1700(+)
MDVCFEDECLGEPEQSWEVSLLQSSLRLSRSSRASLLLGAAESRSPELLQVVGFGLVGGALLLAAQRWLTSRGGEAAGGPASVMTKILFFVFWMSWYQYFSGDPFDAFVESMTHCPTPLPVAGRCPLGSRLSADLCVPEPSSSSNWSLSAHCADKNFVVARAARINGLNASTSATVGMVAVLLAGSYMERLGRRPVLLFFLVASIAVKVLLTLSCFASWTTFVVIMVVQNILEIASATPVYPALNCMIADLSQEDQQLRGDCYASLEAAKNVASLLALLSGYPVLRAHLSSYLLFWASLAAVSLAATLAFWFTLPETLSAATGKEEKADRPPLLTLLWSSLTEGLASCFRNAFLGQYLFIWGVVNLAVNGAWGLSTMYLQSFLGLEQANASLCRALWFLNLFVGAAISASLTKRWGAGPVFAGALGAMALSWFLCGLGGVYPNLAERLFWFCGVGAFGLAYGTASACFGALVAAATAAPGAAFGASVVVGTLLGMPFGPMWSQFLFDPAASGWRAGAPWLASSALLAWCFVWFLAILRPS